MATETGLNAQSVTRPEMRLKNASFNVQESESASFSMGGVDPCFPSEATVELISGAVVRIDTLVHGDQIVATDESGRRIIDEVSFNSCEMLPSPNAASLYSCSRHLKAVLRVIRAQ